MKKTRLHDERGATAVLMAFGIVGLLAFGGLVLDGGNAFSQRRQMQNAVTRLRVPARTALYRYKTGETSGADVFVAARDAAEANGADLSTFACELVLYVNGVETGETPDCQGASPASLDAAWKVRVDVDSTHDTTLMRAVNVDSFTAGAGAAAALLEAIGGNSPIMFCAALGTDHVTLHTPPGPILLPVPVTVDPTGWMVNEDAIGEVYDVWGSSAEMRNSDCGLGNDFKGGVDNENAPFDIPGEWDSNSGVTSGHTVDTPLTDGCDLPAGTKYHDIEVGCIFTVPLCTHPVGDHPFKKLYCVKVGRFEVTSVSSSQMQAVFLGGGLYTGGEAGGVATTIGGPVIIKLVE